MSKRLAKFRRNERDFYPTPKEAIEPLIPWLKGSVKTFAEPCCGDGALVKVLVEAGFTCAYQGDIRGEPSHDALSVPQEALRADAIVTNPPHERQVMHAMIDRFRTLAPTWLLIDWDWAATEQARDYLRSCRYILPIGRVKWIAGSPHVGFDNYAWYLFAAKRAGNGPKLRIGK